MHDKVGHGDVGLALFQVAVLAGVIYYLNGSHWRGLQIFFACSGLGCLVLAFTQKRVMHYVSLFFFLFVAIHLNLLEFSVPLSRLFQATRRHYFFFADPTFNDLLTSRFLINLIISGTAFIVIVACDILWRIGGWLGRRALSNISSGSVSR